MDLPRTSLRATTLALLAASLSACGSKRPAVGGPSPDASVQQSADAGEDAGSDAAVPDAGVPVTLTGLQNPDGTWGIRLDGSGQASFIASQPVRVDTYFFGTPTTHTAGYATLDEVDGGVVGRGSVSPWPGVSFDVTDTWLVAGDTVTTRRALSVTGDRALDRFMDALVVEASTHLPRSAVRYFAPGLIYGGTANLKPDCIGGADTYGPGYQGVVRIREDRLSAPLFGVHFDDGSSLTLLDVAPRGDTIQADGDDLTGSEVTDARLAFGALGAEQTEAAGSALSLGWWFPGSEGEVTYNPPTAADQVLGRLDVGAHTWRLRLHPIQSGLRHEYTLAWRFSSGEDFPRYERNAWRDAWHRLGVSSQVVPHDLETVRRTLTDFTAGRVVTDGGVSGLASAVDVKTGDVIAFGVDQRAYLGFIGKNLENAEYWLREAERRTPSEAAVLRAKAQAVIDTFLAIDQSPPTAEGIRLNGGQLVFYPTDNVCYLRPFTDDVNALLRAYQFEKAHGREHPTWLAWATDFGDWLLTQQGADGSFPRAWNAGAGTVYDASKNMSGLAVPLLLRLAAVTGRAELRTAALRAGEASWQTYLSNERHFVGATPDRPNAMVHEASALALTTYSELFQATGDGQWLDRAVTAADVNESWYVLWNVPPALDASEASLSVKSTVSTVGMDLCTSSNSGVDYYDSNDVDAYARLYLWTHDEHYFEVARLLLHNTKGMMALPGRTYDLSGPGMQQEFWFLAPPRRQSWIREYTPWVTATQLHGIFLTEELDPALFARLAAP